MNKTLPPDPVETFLSEIDTAGDAAKKEPNRLEKLFFSTRTNGGNETVLAALEKLSQQPGNESIILYALASGLEHPPLRKKSPPYRHRCRWIAETGKPSAFSRYH